MTVRLRELKKQQTRQAISDTAAVPDDLIPRAAAALLTAAHRTLYQQVMDLTAAGRSSRPSPLPTSSTVRTW